MGNLLLTFKRQSKVKSFEKYPLNNSQKNVSIAFTNKYYFIFTQYSTTSVTIIQRLTTKMISPIIDLNVWNAQEIKFTLMNNSKMGNCAIVNSETKKSIELKTQNDKNSEFTARRTNIFCNHLAFFASLSLRYIQKNI